LIVVDTGVLVYAVGGPHPLREPARDLISAVRAGAVAATTTPDVLQGFLHIHSRRRPRTEVASYAREWLTLLTPLVATTQEDLPPALRLFERYERLDAFDALLAAVALREHAVLVSGDRAFAEVPKLRFVELGSPEFDRLLG
jgi:predicted nucleic acid-binding protein